MSQSAIVGENEYGEMCGKACGVKTYRSPDKDAARRIWALIQRDAIENGIPRSEWKWQTFAEFWQMYAADQESR